MLGEIFIIVANLFYAIGSLFMEKLANEVNPFVVTSIVVLVGALILLPVFFYFFQEVKLLSSQKFTWAVLAGLFWFVLGELFYVFGLSKTTLSNAAMLSLTFPFFATTIAIIFLGEALSLKFIAGALLMIAGYVLLVI